MGSKQHKGWRALRGGWGRKPSPSGTPSQGPTVTPADVLAVVAVLREGAGHLETMAPYLASFKREERIQAWMAICLAGNRIARDLAALAALGIPATPTDSNSDHDPMPPAA